MDFVQQASADHYPGHFQKKILSCSSETSSINRRSEPKITVTHMLPVAKYYMLALRNVVALSSFSPSLFSRSDLSFFSEE
jgi:hypothetical protein